MNSEDGECTTFAVFTSVLISGISWPNHYKARFDPELGVLAVLDVSIPKEVLLHGHRGGRERLQVLIKHDCNLTVFPRNRANRICQI